MFADKRTTFAGQNQLPSEHSLRLSRRTWLQVGGLWGLSLQLPELLANRAFATTTNQPSQAKACILIWLDGGASHIDLFDPKPNAPSEVRGPFETLQTSLPGVHVSELLPQLAKRLDRCCLIRSVTSPLGEHNLGAQYLLTGYPPSQVLEYPTWLSTLHRCQTAPQSHALPSSIAVPNFDVGGANLSPNGFLPSWFAPFEIGSDPAKPDFQVRNFTPNSPLGTGGPLDTERLLRRQRFRTQMASIEFGNDASPDVLTEQAFALLQSENAKQAFDLAQEPASVKQRYGTRTIGQSCLLARRLVEAGVPLVSVVNPGWDTHADLVTRLRDGFTGAEIPVGLGPNLDQAVSALLDDLVDRGLFAETLVVVMGEFGRTPRANAMGGRDHWPRVFSVLLAGGPIARGAVYGSSDRFGESPDANPVTPADLAHTIFAAMGVDATNAHTTPDGRTIRYAAESGRIITNIMG